MNKLLKEKRRYGLEETVSDNERKQLEAGVPIQKIIGFIDFDNIKINVNRKVLIPRYETQEVVNKALEFIKEGNRVLDLCTGSGYIGLTIKQKCDSCDVVLSDIENEAVIQSTENAKNNKLDVKIIRSDLFNDITGKFDVIVSNPRYIPNANILSDSVIGYDPKVALFGGVDGNDFYKKIIKDAGNYLNENGVLVFEISDDNYEFIKTEGFTILKDINGKHRIAFKVF